MHQEELGVLGTWEGELPGLHLLLEREVLSENKEVVRGSQCHLQSSSINLIPPLVETVRLAKYLGTICSLAKERAIRLVKGLMPSVQECLQLCLSLQRIISRIPRKDFVPIHIKVNAGTVGGHAKVQAVTRSCWVGMYALHEGLTSVNDLHIQAPFLYQVQRSIPKNRGGIPAKFLWSIV